LSRRSSLVRPLGLLVLAVLLGGCSTWAWRVADLRYPAGDAPVPVHPGLDAPGLHPEAYAIGAIELTDRSMDLVLTRAADEGRKRGADAVILLDFAAVTARWTATYAPEITGAEVHREETVDVSSSSATVQATGLRNPRWCVGAALLCDPVADEVGCPVRVGPLVPGGPAEAAGLHTGNRLLEVHGRPVAHAWDAYQWADELGPTGRPLEVLVEGPGETRTLSMTPADCSTLYPGTGTDEEGTAP
jgi:hypothetical protein